MNRTYEVMYIIRPDMEEGEMDKLIEGFGAVVTNGGGEVMTSEKMGRRRLAYVVRKFQDGQYVLMTIAADGKVVAELERRLRVTEQVIKFITVRTDLENKRQAKIKAHRDAHKKMSDSVPASIPASAPAEGVPAAAVAAPEAEAATA